MQLIAGLMFVQHRIRSKLGIFNLRHRFVPARIKCLSLCFHPAHAVPTDGVQQRAQDQFHPFNQGLTAGALLGVRNGPLQIVDNGQDIAQQRLAGKNAAIRFSPAASDA